MEQAWDTDQQPLPPALSSFPPGVNVGFSSSSSSQVISAPVGHWDERNASPSRASAHSASSSVAASTASAPQFQLKRRYGHKHMQPISHITGSVSSINVPANIIPSVYGKAPVKPSSPTKSSHIRLARSNTAPSPKRPPASHSSYGVGTVVGPPPSFDTRRTSSQERVWRGERVKSLRITLGTERAEAQNQVLAIPNRDQSDPTQSLVSAPLLAHSSPDTADTQIVPSPTDAEEVAVMDVDSEQGLGVNHGEVESKSSSESHKSEDLFLNIARVDASRPSSSKGDRRRSRVSLGFMASLRPTTSQNLDSNYFQTDSSTGIPRAEGSLHHSDRPSLHSAQTPRMDHSSEQTSAEASGPDAYAKRSSSLYADTIRPVQRTGTSIRSGRFVSEGGFLDRSKPPEHNATESTISTTAPSTVWDELDDLKSRIRKLELTGKLPPSSAAAMSTAERPRTATTAATTMSSSPKHNNVALQLPLPMEGVSSAIHPLLQEALSNAKSVVAQEIYQKLQIAAQDALQLASLTSLDSSIGRNSSATTDRQIRRRTESMCRSLTELAIALAADSRPPPPANRPPSREYSMPPNSGLRSRRYSQSTDPSDRPPVSARVQSRLESRRTSTQLTQGNTTYPSPSLDSPATLPQYPGPGNRTTIVSGGLRTRRNQNLVDGANDDESYSPAIRPVSRAMTDVAAARRLSREYASTSREYTSQHPLPTTLETTSLTRTPLPSSLSTTFISRRKHPSPVSAEPDSSPLAPRQPWGRISIVHQDTPPPSDTVSEAPGPGRSINPRRSIGFASRLGTSVGNRFRTAKTERIESRYYDDSPHSIVGEDLNNLSLR